MTSSDASPTRCARCGAESLIESAFRLSWWADGPLCPRCQNQSRRWAWGIASVLVWLLLWAGSNLALRDLGISEFWRFILAWPTVVVLMLVMTALHEATHAGAGAAVGAGVHEIRIGQGAAVWTFRIARARVFLAWNLTRGGWCQLSFSPRRLSRRRIAAAVGAPGVLHVVAVFALIPASTIMEDLAAFGIVDLLLLLNLWFAVINLWPTRFRFGSIDLASDGRLLLDLVVREQAMVDWVAGGFVLRAMDACRRGDQVELGGIVLEAENTLGASDEWGLFIAWLHLQANRPDEAIRWAEEATAATRFEIEDEEARQLLLGHTPVRLQAPILLFGAYERTGRIADVIQICERQLEVKAGDAYHAIWCNNLAYALARHVPAPSNLQRARALSDSSLGRLPWIGCVRGTAGIVAIISQEYERGMRLLDEADALEGNPASSGIRCAYRAMALAQLGRHQAARRQLRLASIQAVDRDLVSTAEQTVQQAAATHRGAGGGGAPPARDGHGFPG